MHLRLKTRIRDFLPKSYQVPIKYWYGWFRGSHEAELKLLDKIVRQNDHTVDIGGNRGLYAYLLCRIGAKVDVFEPNPRCFEILSAWAANKKQVNVYSVALSNIEGKANLHIPIDKRGEEHDASASMENTAFLISRDQLVSLRTLDSYRFEEVDFIKIDVEGHEYKVIEGAASTISKSKPALLIEIEQRHNTRTINEIFEKVSGFGYQGFFLEGERLVTLEKFDPSRHQSIENFSGKERYVNNFLFLHRDKLRDGKYDSLVCAKD